MIDISKYTNSPIRFIPQDYCPKKEYNFFEIQYGIDAGKKMFYRDSFSGNKAYESSIVFVHGNPESSYTYRKVIKSFSQKVKTSHRIIAMDHIGYGLSDQATHEMVCMDHTMNLLQLIRKLDLQNVTLIVHDWGGPIGIGAFLKEPERVSNLILLNTTVFPIPKKGLTFKNYPISWLGWCYTPYIIPDYFWGHFAAYAMYTDPYNPIPLLSNMIKNFGLMEFNVFQNDNSVAQMFFKEQFKSRMNIRSSKRLVKQTKFWGHGNTYCDPQVGKRSTKEFYKFIQENIKKAWSPEGSNIKVRAILGRWDPLAQNNVIKQWIDNLPQLKNNYQIYENIGHFIEETKFIEIADVVLKLVE